MAVGPFVLHFAAMARGPLTGADHSIRTIAGRRLPRTAAYPPNTGAHTAMQPLSVILECDAEIGERYQGGRGLALSTGACM